MLFDAGRRVLAVSANADPATTLREYAYALPLTDAPVVADALERHLLEPPAGHT